MRSVSGSLLLALVPLMAAGCTLPDRSLGRIGGPGFRQKSSSRPRFSSKPSVENEYAAKGPERSRLSTPDDFDSRVSQMRNRRDDANLKSKTASKESAEFNAGHSTDFSTSEEKSNARSRSVQQASASRSDDFTWDDQDSDTSSGMIGSGIRHNDFPQGGDPESNPIRLQGMEIDRDETAFRPASPGDKGSVIARRSEITSDFSDESQIENFDDVKIPAWDDRPGNRNRPRSSRTEQPPNRNVTDHAGSTASRERVPDETNAGHARKLPALPWQTELEALIRRAERELAESKPDGDGERQNEYLRTQANLRLLYLMAQRQEQALTAIPGIEPAQQEYWQQLIWAMSNSFDTERFPESTERAAQTVTPLSAALRQVRDQAELSIKNMTFCRKISYFGNYERFPRNEFTPGYEVLLYTEIENFASAPTVDGEYKTSLKSSIEITDSSGKVVWTKAFPSTEDLCRNPRRDYFHNYQFHIPEDLSAGEYALKLTIVDELSRKRVSNSLSFALK